MSKEKPYAAWPKEKTDQNKNAVHSIEARPRFGFHAPVEWKTMILKFDNLMNCESEQYSERKITEALTAGWYFSKEIICPPYVVLVFWRQKEVENNGQ